MSLQCPMDDEEIEVEYFLGCAADPTSREIRFRNTAGLSWVAGGSTGKLTILECS